MYIYELNDVIFFIKSYKSSFKHFNINDYIKFSESNTRSGTSSKMIHHRSSSNISHNSYFCRLPRLWNSLPPIDLTLPIPTIKHKLFIFYGTILPNTSTRAQSALIIITAPAVTVDVQVQDHHYLTDYHLIIAFFKLIKTDLPGNYNYIVKLH